MIEGQEIQQGTVVGIQGGDPNRDPNPVYSTGSHLHFEIRKSQRGDFINLREYLFGSFWMRRWRFVVWKENRYIS